MLNSIPDGERTPDIRELIAELNRTPEASCAALDLRELLLEEVRDFPFDACAEDLADASMKLATDLVYLAERLDPAIGDYC